MPSPPFHVQPPAPDDAARLAEQHDRQLSRRARRRERAAAQPSAPLSLDERLDRLEALLTWLVCQFDGELGADLIHSAITNSTKGEFSMTPDQERALGLRTTTVHGLRFTGTSADGEVVVTDVPCSLIAVPTTAWLGELMAHDEQRRGRRDGGDDDV